MELLENVQVLDFGVTMALLLVIYRGLSIGGQYWLNKKSPGPTVATLACQQDPMHFQRIKEIHQMTVDTEKQKASGKFKCLFKNRDEVRDLMDIMKQNVEATKALTAELRLTRNGKGKV